MGFHQRNGFVGTQYGYCVGGSLVAVLACCTVQRKPVLTTFSVGFGRSVLEGGPAVAGNVVAEYTRGA